VFLGAAIETLGDADGITLVDGVGGKEYPMPALLEGSDDVFIGRLRIDPSVKHGIAMWVVADQLRKGAALNAVQIAEALIG
jgi:aspartate-semialdehyde dehydrogenase